MRTVSSNTQRRASGTTDPPRSDKSRQPAGPRRLQRQTEIVDVAAHLFARQGYNATGIAELCEAVGLGKGSLYYYIESKERLLSKIHDRVMEHVLQSAADIEAIEASPSERLRMLGIELLKIITQYPDHVWVFLHEWKALKGEGKVEFKRKRRLYEDTVERVFQQGVDSGEFDIDDTRLAVHAWLGMHNYTYQWFRVQGRLNAFQIANQYYDIFLNGIRKPAFATVGAADRRLTS
jgi:TetR/AcrR family transcriptional regulator, cholesterol catabolism regulator